MEKVNWIFLLFGILLVSNFAHKVAAASTETSNNEDYHDDEDDADDEEVPPGTVASISSQPQQIVVDEGKKVELPCFGENIRYFATLWKKGDAYLTNNEITVTTDKRFSVSAKGDRSTLMIDNVNSADNGEYTCTVQDSTKILATVTHKLTVKEMPRVWTVPTKVVKANEPATIFCNATGYPEPEIYWERKGKRMPSGELVTKGSSIRFASVSRHHAGTYECFANNSQGTARTAMELHVMHAPEIELERESVNSGLNTEAELVCFVHAEPKAHVVWVKDGKHINQHSHDKHHVVQKSAHHWTLHIMNVNEGDYGKYACMANNSLGRDQKVIELSGVPSQPVLKDSSLGKDQMSYTLSWTLESADKVDAIKLRYRKAEGEWQDVDVTGQPAGQPNLYTVTYTLTDLSPSSDYEATLTAHNSFGWSKDSVVRSFHLNGDPAGSASMWRTTPLVLAAALILPIVRWSKH